MANAISTSFSHTYAGRELITELFFTPREEVDAIEQLYRVIQTVDKTNIYIPNSLSKILRKYTGCGFTAAGGVTTIDDKVIQTEKVKANVEQCVEAFADTIFYEAMKKGVDINDLSGTVVDSILRKQFMDALTSDIHRIFWFADSADADADWNQFDGLISLFLDNSAGIGAARFIDMDGTAFETADVIQTDGSFGLLKQMWENQTAVLRSVKKSDKKFYVTNTVLDNLTDTYEDLGSSTGLLRLINGGEMAFRGVPVVAVPEWDLNLADATNPHNGTGLNIGSNLIVYSTPDNIVIGTDVSSPANEFKIRHDDDDSETTKVISKFKLGAQFVHDSLVVVAF